MTALIVIASLFILLVVIVILWAVGAYNKLVKLRNRFKNAFSQIDVQLKRRYDLIPNLIETAKGYLSHERETLEAVISARNSAQKATSQAAANPDDADAIKGLIGAETILSGAVTKFMALAEAYPDLKANQNMMPLTDELTSTENKVSFARQAYNDSVMEYNTARETFPTVLIANTMNFKEAALFEIEDQVEREAPKVSFE